MFKFEERTALITGGAGGIGLSIAKALGEQKMNIVLTDVDEKNLLQSAAELESLGVPVLAAALDTADEMQWQSVAKQAVARFGKVHMVVNNAGVGGVVCRGAIQQRPEANAVPRRPRNPFSAPRSLRPVATACLS